MGRLLAIVLPLALGAAVTPTIIAVQLLQLTAKTRPVARAWALAGGAAVVLVGVSVLALLVAAGSGGSDSPSRAGGIVKLVAALLLVGLGVRALRHRGDPPKPEHESDGRPHLGRAFVLGMGMMATNFSSLVLYFPAMHAIGISDTSDEARGLALVLLFTITMLPAYGPPLVVGLLGPRAQRPLDRLSGFFTAHRQAIAATLCFGFAVLLAAAGLHALL
jgi:threonine/homoserine/homoserine lactone efflux protein